MIGWEWNSLKTPNGKLKDGEKGKRNVFILYLCIPLTLMIRL